MWSKTVQQTPFYVATHKKATPPMWTLCNGTKKYVSLYLTPIIGLLLVRKKLGKSGLPINRIIPYNV